MLVLDIVTLLQALQSSSQIRMHEYARADNVDSIDTLNVTDDIENTNTLKWYIDRDLIDDRRVFSNLEIAKYVCSHRTIDAIIRYAIESGDINLINWLHDIGEFHIHDIKQSISYGNMNVLLWAHASFDFEYTMFDIRKLMHETEIIIWIMHNIGGYTIDFVASYGDIELIEEIDPCEITLHQVIVHDQLDMLKYFVSAGFTVTIDQDAINTAAAQGRYEMLRWIKATNLGDVNGDVIQELLVHNYQECYDEVYAEFKHLFTRDAVDRVRISMGQNWHYDRIYNFL